MKCMACGYDPSVIKDRLELYSKKHLPDDKLFLRAGSDQGERRQVASRLRVSEM